MASINQHNGKIFFDFRWQGQRHREYTQVPDTPANRDRAEAVLKHMLKNGLDRSRDTSLKS